NRAARPPSRSAWRASRPCSRSPTPWTRTNAPSSQASSTSCSTPPTSACPTASCSAGCATGPPVSPEATPAPSATPATPGRPATPRRRPMNGELMALSAAACYGITHFVCGLLARRVPGLTVSLYAQLGGTAVSILAALILPFGNPTLVDL